VGAVRTVILLFWHVPGPRGRESHRIPLSREEDNDFGGGRYNPDGVCQGLSLCDLGGRGAGVDPAPQIQDNSTGEKDGDGCQKSIHRRRRQEPD